MRRQTDAEVERILELTAMGWSNKTFRVIGCTEHLDGSLSVILREEQSADWADLAAGEYNTPSAVTVPTNAVPRPDVPSGFAISVLTGQLQFSWTPGEHRVTGGRFQIFDSSGSAISSNDFSLLLDDAKPGVSVARADVSTRFYWLRDLAPDSAGSFGGFCPASFGLAGVPGATATNSLRILSANGTYKVSGGPNITTDAGAVSVTAAGGTPASYSYAWSQSSGSVMSVLGVNSSKPRFTSSGFANPESRVGYWRCAVSDATNSVSSPVINVEFLRDNEHGA